MAMTRSEMDRRMDEHFAFEAKDDIAGVLATLAADAEHDIVGWPSGPTRGRDAARPFYEALFGWKVASEGAFPGYTFIDTGAEGGTYVAISPRQSTEDEVLFFVAVEDVAATLAKAEGLGGSIVQPVQHVTGTSFGVFADDQGHRIGVAANG